MLQFLPVFEGNTIAVRATGQLSHEDYQSFLPKLEEQINQLGKVSVLIELNDFSGWDLDAAKDDFKFSLEHGEDFERIAIVGDKEWEHWMVAMAKPFLPFQEVRYFNRENLQDAWDWLREPDKLREAADNLQGYKTIVVPVNFSLSAKHSAKRAFELANLYDAKVTLIHVVHEIIPYPSDDITGYAYDPLLLESQNKELLKQAKKEMEAFITNLEPVVDAKTEVMQGDIEKTLVSFIAAANTDLVVLASSHKSGIAKFLGSIPQYIQNHTRCETLVVPLINQESFH